MPPPPKSSLAARTRTPSQICNEIFKVWLNLCGHSSALYRAAAFDPVLEAAEVVNALIAHVFENLAAER